MEFGGVCRDGSQVRQWGRQRERSFGLCRGGVGGFWSRQHCAGGHVGRIRPLLSTSLCDWHIIFSEINSAHYHGNDNEAGGGSQRRPKSWWNLGSAFGGGGLGLMSWRGWRCFW